jgi:putative SOS response-associated peptidase YedK
MCGRFLYTSSNEELRRTFELQGDATLSPRANIAPGQPVGAVRLAEGARARELTVLKWGLVPSWSKSPGDGHRMINARGETLADKPAFSAPFKRRRCLLPASGFYEWAREGKARQAWLIRLLDGEIFALAGLWERWQSADGLELETCAILTTTPNERVAAIHDRMPVILDPEAHAAWLDPATRPDELAGLIVPFPADRMETWPVSTRVGDVRNDDPDLTRPVPRQGRLL